MGKSGEIAARMSQYKITVAGDGGCFPAAAEDTILSAALRAGIGIPYECSSGGCGSCKVELCSGTVFLRYPESPGLKARDFERGKRLACMSLPQRDCVIRFREDVDARPRVKPIRRGARLLARIPLTHDLWEFRFILEGSPRFLAGQYALLHLPGIMGGRAFSMSNRPDGENVWAFQIKRVPGGHATGILFDELHLGDQIEIDGPYSTAYLHIDEPRDIVCVAGGSGLAPVLSIARTALADRRFPSRKIHFFYGGRTMRDMIDPAALGLDDERVQFVPVVSDADETGGAAQTLTLASGLVHEQVGVRLSEPYSAYEFYLAGPPLMVEAARRLLLLEKSVPVHQVHYDRFF